MTGKSVDAKVSTHRTENLKVVIMAPGPESEGGIRSVVESIVTCLDLKNGIDVNWIPTHRSGSSIAKLQCFFSALRKALISIPRCSVVHIHASVGTSLLRKSIFIWMAVVCRRPIIFHFHATQIVFEEFFDQGGLVTAYSLLVLRKCMRVVVLSDRWRGIVKKVLPDSHVTVLHNPILDVSRSPEMPQGDDKVVLYLAHLIERKGYKDLIHAFARVLRSIEEARLVFCGSGELETARRLCVELGISDNVEFRGWISKTEKVRQLYNATVFCLPSYDEGLPMGILEAMGVGVPIVTTPVGGIPDVLTHGVNALIVSPGDCDNLSRQIVRLLQDDKLRQKLAGQAIEDSRSFHPDRIAADWLDLYNKVTARVGS